MLNEDSIVNGEYEFRNRKSIKIIMPKGSSDKDILPAITALFYIELIRNSKGKKSALRMLEKINKTLQTEIEEKTIFNIKKSEDK